MEAICNLWNRRWTPELLSRLLVLLTGVLLLAMPLTEYFCDWDHFLRGGSDVEFTVLALLLFAAMVVLTMNGTILRPRWMAPDIQQAAAAEHGFARRMYGRGQKLAPGQHSREKATASREASCCPMRI